MSFPCLKTSTGSPLPTIGNSSNSLSWHMGSSVYTPFRLILVISPYCVHLQTLSTYCYSSMLLCSLLCPECLSLFALSAMNIFIQSCKAQHTFCFLSDLSSPVDLISPYLYTYSTLCVLHASPYPIIF